MWWLIISGIIDLALKAYDAFKTDATIVIFPQQCVQQILDAIDDARLTIIKEARGTRLADLDGSVMGMTVRFSEYDRYDEKTQYDQWVSEGERLREIIDDSAGVMKTLEAEINRLDLNAPNEVDYAAKVYAFYAVLIPLRTVAMLERTLAYHTDDMSEIPPIFDAAGRYTDRMYAALKRKSDAQFSPDYVKRRGEPMGQGKYMTQYGYTFKHSFVLVGEVPPGSKPAYTEQVIRKARARLGQRKQVVFKAYQGVAPVLMMSEYLPH